MSPPQRQRVPARVVPPSSGSPRCLGRAVGSSTQVPQKAQLNICLPLLWVVYSILMLSSAAFYFKGPCDTLMQSALEVRLAPGLCISSIIWDIPWTCAPLMQDRRQEHHVTDWDALLFPLFSMGRNVWAKPNFPFFHLK